MIKIATITLDDLLYIVRQVIDAEQGPMHQVVDFDAEMLSDSVVIIIQKIKGDCTMMDVWDKTIN